MGKLFRFVLLVMLTISGRTPLRAGDPLGKETPTLPPRDRFHFYLLIGQSNMVGRDKLQAEDRLPHPRVLMLTSDLKWVPASDPLPHEEGGAGVGVGPGMTFARILAERDAAVTIGLVAAAWGGTPMQRWVKGADLYEKAIVRARAAQRDGVLKGILWQQGESDSYTVPLARSYKAKLIKLIHDLRADLNAPGVPVVTGEICQFKHPSFPHYKIINKALVAAAREAPNVGFVSVDGLSHMGDQAHIDTPSQRRMGKAFAAEMIRVQEAMAAGD